MEEFNYNEKVAILRILKEIQNADNVVRDSEVEYMNDVIQSFGLGDGYKEDVNHLMTLQALATIREMSVEQKGEVAKMMGKMIVVDKDINYNEVKLYNTFCESCCVEKDFNIEDYPEYTLSGTFVNPEDMMNGI